MRILLTNSCLAEGSGTETWTRDFALALAARGHEPILYTMIAGALADDLRARGVRVVTRLRETGAAPDVVHAHHPQGVAALAWHRDSPGLFVAHDFSIWTDAPPLLPRFYRYVAVDEPNRERLLARGTAPERTSVILNSVDLARFPARDRLPAKPRRALLFSNYATERTHLPAVREACARAGLALDVAGLGSGRPVPRPEEILSRYDVVFAKARCALEALATGCAVILCDAWGAGSYVTASDVDRMRPLNFGRKLLTSPVTVPHLLAELDRYDADDAGEASRRVRAVAGLDEMVDRFVDLYAEVIAEHARARPRRWAERRALLAYALGLPVPGLLAVTPVHAWMRRTEPIASLLAVRRSVLARLGRPGY